MTAFYNEIDPYAAQWLRNLIDAGHIAPGVVDERSIVDIEPAELAGYTQCHFFAGIGGWSYALRLAGWPDDRPVWTGSCPCQGHSTAARGRHVHADLWPIWRNLIAASAPPVVFGEQVAVARRWLAGVGDDLEAMGYAFGSAELPACSVGFDHARARLWFVGDANGHSEPSMSFDAQMDRMSRGGCFTGINVSSDGLPRSVVGMRSGFGNAIVPQVAAAFIEASKYQLIDLCSAAVRKT